MPNPNTKGISVHVNRELHAEITAYLQENNMKMGDFIAIAAQELLRPPSTDIDPELKAEIDSYLEENNVTMSEFFAQAAQNELHPHIPGIGSKLQAEINAYLEEHDMAMDEFMAIAARGELQAKPSEVEVKEVVNTRTLAFQVPEKLFLRIKDYLKRNNMTQRAFAIGLIEKELDRDEELLRKQQEGTEQAEEEEQAEGISEDSEAPVSEESPEVEYGDEPEGGPAVGDSEGGSEPEDEEELGQDMPAPEYYEGEQDEGLSGAGETPVSEEGPVAGYGDELKESPNVGNPESSFEPEDEEEADEGYEELEDGEFPEEAVQDTTVPEYVEGELGAAVEVATNFDHGQNETSGFPESDDEEETEDFGMNMGM